MNNKYRKTAFAFAITLSVLLAFTLLTGCGKKNDDAKPSAPKTAASGLDNTLQSAEKTSFVEVTSHLDAGGNVYGFLNTAEWFEGLSGKMDDWRDAALSLPNISAADRMNVHKAFDLAGQFVKLSGVESVGGVGFSGIALEPGYYQTKFFVHRGAASADGLLWSATGKAARPLTELDWLPADTAWAMFTDLDFSAVWNLVKKELEQANLPEVSQGLQTLEAEVKKSTGTGLSELLSSLGGQYGIVLTLDASRKVSIPTFNEAKLEVPEPGLLIAVKVKDDQLFDLIDKNSKKQAGIISSDEGGLKMRTMPVPLPLPITLRPTVARYRDFLFLATSDALMQTIAETQSGKKPGLKTTAEFQRLAKGMPTEGNQLVYVSENLGKTVRDVQEAYMNSPLAKIGDQQAAAALMRKLFQSNPVSSTYSVGGHLEDGWLNVMHGNKNPVTVMAAPLVVAPVAILAGITVPAFAKARDRAQSITCVNNMKQIAIGARRWSYDNDGVFPPDIESMKDEIGTPKILLCPKDKARSKNAEATWETFDFSASSYEYLLPNAKEDETVEKVLLRCKIHGHTALGDGSVHQSSNKVTND